MKQILLVLLLCLAPRVLTGATNPLERDLGLGLTYFRVHDLSADLPPATTRPGALVLDLRYAHDADAAASSLGGWLRIHCSKTTPVFVLLNADTAPAALAYFSDHEPVAGLVTLGPASPTFLPDIALTVSAKADRVAYDALDHGTTIDALLHSTAVKVRHDEASIAQEHTANPSDESADSDTDLADAPAAANISPPPPPQVIDYTLLRAVQLHRALLALKKL